MKKVLSLVLALVMVLGSFSFVAAADFSDVNGTNNGEAITRLSELNLLKGYPDGTFKPENQITRAEFAAVMVRAKGLEAVAETTKGLPTGFNDVAGFHWASGYVGTASKAGIVNGIGNGLFAPEAPVKYEDAITMVVRALGYEASAQTKGGYPYGYLIVASELDLLEDARGTQGLPATRAFVAQITDNALEVPMMVQVGFGSDAKWVVSGSKEHGDEAQERYLLDEMGFDYVEGRVESYNESRNTVRIDRTNYDVADGFDFYEVHGVEIKAWLDGEEVIVYKLLEDVLFDAVEYEDADEIALIVADEEYDLAEDAKFVLNGDDKVKYDKNFKADYAKVVLDDDGDVIFVDAYKWDNFLVVEEVEDDVVLGYDYEIEAKDFTIVKDGKTITVEDIEEEDIVFYHEKAEFAEVFNKAYEGTLERVYDDSFRLDGEEYDYLNENYEYTSAQYLDGDKLKDFTATVADNMRDEGEDVTIFVDRNDNVVYVIGETGEGTTSSFYAYIIAGTKELGGRGNRWSLDVVTAADEVVEYDVDVTDIEYDGTWVGDIVKDNVVKIEVDEDGDIKTVTLMGEALENKDFKTKDRYVGGKRLLSSAVVFDVEDYIESDKKGDIVVSTFGDLDYEDIDEADVYYNAKDEVVVIVVEKSARGGETTTYKAILTDEDISKVRNKDTWRLTLSIDGVEKDYYTEEDRFEQEDIDALTVGDFLEVKITDDTNEIREIAEATPTESGVVIEKDTRNNTITVEHADETEEEYRLADATILDEDYDKANLRDIEEGDSVNILLVEDDSVYAKYVVITEADDNGDGNGDDDENEFVANLVVVELANTFEVTIENAEDGAIFAVMANGKAVAVVNEDFVTVAQLGYDAAEDVGTIVRAELVNLNDIDTVLDSATLIIAEGEVIIIEADTTVELEDILGDNLNDVTDEVVVIIIPDDSTVTWTTGATHDSTPLIPTDSDVETVILRGGTFLAEGSGVGPIRAANGGKLVFEDMTIVDESESYAEHAWEFMYLEFSGEVDFKNCTFENGIMFEGDIVTFTGCTFTSPKSDEYGVWIDNGTASFNNCEFNGYRGLKIHEAYGSDISSVTVDNSTFGPLSLKAGVDIGTLDSSTAVTIKNSTFDRCQPGEQDMYIYESDTDTTSFNFTIENNTIIK